MPTIDPEDSIVHFTYNALGRLIAKQAPWPAIPGEIRTEIYLHDGVRRIQEIWRQPAQGNGSQGGQNQNNQGPPTYVDITEREYIHSPGYVDEFVCEIDTGGPSDKFWWVLQDPNYNVVALVSDGDGSGGASSGGTYRGEVARQYSWSPYGQLLRADIYDTSAPMSRLGHQGLFHDRLDADILTEPMVAFSDQVVQNRNRTLSPRLGRFLQRDPNASSIGALSVLMRHGGPAGAAIGEVSAEEIYGDGMSLFAYLASSPTVATDPSGLFIMGMMFGMGEAGSINAEYNDNVMDVGGGLKGLLEGFLAGASMNQYFDAEWALDWSQPDDAYSGAAMSYTNPGRRADGSGWAMGQAGFPRWLNPLIRGHGGARHIGKIRQIAASVVARGVPLTSMRMNQALVDLKGRIIKVRGKRKRPDLQWIENEKVHIVEVYDSQPPAAARALEAPYREALGDLFGSFQAISAK